MNLSTIILIIAIMFQYETSLSAVMCYELLKEDSQKIEYVEELLTHQRQSSLGKWIATSAINKKLKLMGISPSKGPLKFIDENKIIKDYDLRTLRDEILALSKITDVEVIIRTDIVSKTKIGILEKNRIPIHLFENTFHDVLKAKKIIRFLASHAKTFNRVKEFGLQVDQNWKLIVVNPEASELSRRIQHLQYHYDATVELEEVRSAVDWESLGAVHKNQVFLSANHKFWKFENDVVSVFLHEQEHIISQQGNSLYYLGRLIEFNSTLGSLEVSDDYNNFFRSDEVEAYMTELLYNISTNKLKFIKRDGEQIRSFIEVQRKWLSKILKEEVVPTKTNQFFLKDDNGGKIIISWENPSVSLKVDTLYEIIRSRLTLLNKYEQDLDVLLNQSNTSSISVGPS